MSTIVENQAKDDAAICWCYRIQWNACESCPSSANVNQAAHAEVLRK